MLADLFYLGDYRRIVALAVDGDATPVAAEDAPFVVGALTYLGRLADARVYFDSRREELSPAAIVIARYFLGVGYCRHFQYPAARRYLAANAREKAALADPTARFFVYQGLGFYRYFTGAFARAQDYAQRAYEAAFAARYTYGRIVTLDLLGHARIQTGRIRQGLATLDEARDLAAGIGRGWIVAALDVTATLYRSNFGISGAAALDELTRAVSKLGLDDSYNRQAILLEIARVHCLRGEVAKARTTLAEAGRRVYQVDNPRLETLLNLRHAHLHLIEGDVDHALNLVRNATRQVEGGEHLALEVSARGFEARLLTMQGLEAEAARARAAVATATQRSGQWIARRIQARARGEFFTSIAPGQDPLGDLLDLVARQGAAACRDVLASGWLGLLHRALEIPYGARLIYLDVDGRGLTMFDRGDVEHVARGATHLGRRLLEHLGRVGESSKEALTGAVWGPQTTYHPLRHDPLIYSLIAKLRRLSPRLAAWIEATESGYRLAPGVTLRTLRLFADGPGAAEAHDALPGDADAAPDESDGSPAAWANDAGNAALLAAAAGASSGVGAALTYRQIEIVRYVRGKGPIDVQLAKRLFAVSDVTASRDLSALERLGVLQRLGRGRAIKYVLAGAASAASASPSAGRIM